MTALPPALAPWARELELLPRDLALGLYPLVARLASALGELRAHAWAASSEPDGYEGLARRGPYTRLLASEWLLASELPDEFLRRAAAAEHAFLQLKHGEPAGARRSLLLFDCGPSVLGAPRIVQLALLIVLARRARSAGVVLGFGALQDPGAGFCAELSAATLLQWLHARSARPASDSDAAAWLDHAGPLQQHDDLWLLGGAELAQLAAFERWPRVLLEEALDPGERCVRARVLRAGKAPVQLQLALPEPALCVRLLRDPLSAARAPVQRVPLHFDPARPIAFSSDGRRVQVWLQDGAIASLPVPNSPRATPGKPRVFRPPPGERLLGLGSYTRRFFALTQQGDRFFSYGCSGARTLGNRAEHRLQDDFEPVPTPEQPLGVLLGSGDQRWFYNAKRELFELTSYGTWLRSMRDTHAVAPAPGGGLVVVTLEREPSYVISTLPQAASQHPPMKITTRAGMYQELRPRVFIGYLSPHARCIGFVPNHDGNELAIWPPPPGRSERSKKVWTPRLCTRHGVVGLDDEPALLLLDDTQRVLSLFNEHGEVMVARADGKIREVTASAASPHFAYLTEHGELVVHSLAHDAVVLCTKSEPA